MQSGALLCVDRLPLGIRQILGIGHQTDTRHQAQTGHQIDTRLQTHSRPLSGTGPQEDMLHKSGM